MKQYIVLIVVFLALASSALATKVIFIPEGQDVKTTVQATVPTTIRGTAAVTSAESTVKQTAVETTTNTKKTTVSYDQEPINPAPFIILMVILAVGGVYFWFNIWKKRQGSLLSAYNASKPKRFKASKRRK
jgi:lysozyme family protein